MNRKVNSNFLIAFFIVFMLSRVFAGELSLLKTTVEETYGLDRSLEYVEFMCQLTALGAEFRSAGNRMVYNNCPLANSRNL